ncbi:MAG: hypothetical protein WC851_04595 [Candidatus Shapirobacteria bacterium]|jgi:hypothetical protein
MKENMKPWEVPPDMWSEWQKYGAISTMNSQVNILLASTDDVEAIVGLVLGQEALVGVGNHDEATKTISDFIQLGNGLVAKNTEGEVVAFQGLGLWSDISKCELRSAITDKKYLGNGINTLMKTLMIRIASEKYPDWQFVGFTEATSKSRGILTKLGFEETPMESVRQNLPSLGEGCPPVEVLPDNEKGCFLRCGGNCGCKVYLLTTK